VQTQKTINFCDHLSWEHTYIFSLLPHHVHTHNYNSFQTLCIKLMQSFNISSCNFIKICLLLEETKLIWDWKRSFGGWKEVQRQDEDRMTLLKVRVFFFGQFFEETQSIILRKSFSKDPVSPVILFYSDFILFLKKILVLLVLWFWNCSRTRNSRLQPTKSKDHPTFV
jgi:hypothetical protein